MVAFPVPSKAASELRQRLVSTRERHFENLERILTERGALIRGSFGTRQRKCGKPTCRCVNGEGHSANYLAASDGGKFRQVHVPEQDLEEVRDGTARYLRFREAEAKLAELGEMELRLVAELCDALLKPYPPNAPFPPRTHRGRRPKPKKR